MHKLVIDIGATKTLIGVVNESGTISHRSRLSSSKVFRSEGGPVTALARIVRSYCQHVGMQLGAVEGVGIGFPGAMDREAGRISVCANLPVLDGAPLGSELAETLGTPVVIENDTNLMALGESRVGAGKDIDDLACVSVGSGIGCGLILDGQLYLGADGLAGEFGHTVIEPNGRPCTCGGKGCLEMYCSGKALSLQANILLGAVTESAQVSEMALGSWTAAERLIDAAKSGHSAALQAMHTAFHHLGLGIVTLVNMLNPRLVILGGGITTAWPVGMDVVRQTVRTRAMPMARHQLLIQEPTLGEDAVLIGASALLTEWLQR